MPLVEGQVRNSREGQIIQTSYLLHVGQIDLKYASEDAGYKDICNIQVHASEEVNRTKGWSQRKPGKSKPMWYLKRFQLKGQLETVEKEKLSRLITYWLDQLQPCKPSCRI